MPKNRLLLPLSLAAGMLLPGVCSAAIPKGMDLPSCAAKYAPEFGVDVILVQSIRVAEGGKVGQSVCGNANATCDHGPMQINDGWFDGRWGVNLPLDYGVTKTSVLDNECQNIRVGMWVLRQAYMRLGNWYEAVAAYNAGITNRKAGYKYADRVFRWYKKLDGKKLKLVRDGEVASNSHAPVTAKQERRKLVRVSGI